MKKIFILSFLALSILACKNTAKEQPKATDNADVAVFAQKYADVGAGLRKPGDVADMLVLSGTRFMPSLVNDPMNYVHYQNDPISAGANIGVYMFDALYQIAFDKKYEGYLSASAAKQLAIQIGVDGAFSEFMRDRYSEGDAISDSVENSIRTALSEFESILTENDQTQIFAAILVGNYIEKLHTLLTNIFDYPVDLPEESKLLVLRDMILISSAQLDLLPDVIAIVDQHKKDGSSYLLKELKDIQTIRDQYGLTKSEIEKLQAEMIFENEALKLIYEKIKASRSIIIATE